LAGPGFFVWQGLCRQELPTLRQPQGQALLGHESSKTTKV
jgi:hypothetical protein